MGPRAVLFDIGDTLWRYPGDHPEHLVPHYEEARRLLPGPDVPTAEALLTVVSARFDDARKAFFTAADRGTQPPTLHLLEEALSRLGLRPPQEAIATFADRIARAEVELAATQPPEEDMVEALEMLRLRGLRLAAVSNTFVSERVLRDILEARGLLRFLEAVVSSADVGFRKPHPECFRPALAALRVEPGEAVFVGDRMDTDIEGAVRLGMTAVLTHQYRQDDPERGPFPPHHVISHLAELTALLGRSLP